MRTKLHYVFSISLFLVGALVFGQKNQWTKISYPSDKGVTSTINLKKNNTQFYRLNAFGFKQSLESAPLRGGARSNTVIIVPTSGGQFESFKVYEAPVLSSKLSELYPEIKSYLGFSLDNPGTRLRMSVSTQGVQTMISSLDKETIFMQPLEHGSSDYMVYAKSSKSSSIGDFNCSTLDELSDEVNIDSGSLTARDANDQTLRTYRLIVSTTGEYTTYHGGTVAGALAAINATVTRVNEIYETDMAINFTVVAESQYVIFTDGTTDPYSDPAVGTAFANSNSLQGWNLQLQNELTTNPNVGNAVYDIGHLFGDSGGGGNAGCIGCVCEDDSANQFDKNKGSAYTSPADGVPEGDTFDIDYVAHEMGHQMGANHTFAYVTEGTNVNAEPGSGTTIMGYAGVVSNPSDNVQLHSDAYFHFHSINQILTNVGTSPNTCAVLTPISNNPPVAEAGSSYTIPIGTAYVLKGSATDADGGDTLSYCWEQTNSGQVSSSNFGPDLVNGPMNRSLPPSSSPDRYIPKLSRVLNGQLTETNPTIGSDWETVSNVTRSMTWALTVRDRDGSATGLNGQSSYDLTAVTVTANAGPFVVTSQATSGIIWNQGNTETVTWDVAGTSGVPVNTSNVNILLSTDGGLNFDTVLAANTPNDGTEDIVVPSTPAPYCRIKVEPVGNIYYAVNSESFSIDYTISNTCMIYSNNTPLVIPDGIGNNVAGAVVGNFVDVLEDGLVTDVNVTVSATHTYIEDLIIVLNHPDDTQVPLWVRRCDAEDAFNVTFDDEAAASIPETGCTNPFNGTYQPYGNLSDFDNKPTMGQWTLLAVDYFNGDTGQINNWQLEVCMNIAQPLSNEEFSFTDFSLFPNPNNGEFTVKFRTISGQDSVDIQVSDIRGRTIFSNNYGVTGSEFNETINLGQLQSGMYLVNVTDGQRKITKKIIVE